MPWEVMLLRFATMAKAGNHGIIIPRNKALLSNLYWKQRKTLTEIGAMFGVNHKSTSKVFDQLGIPKRKRRTKGQSRWTKCIVCGGEVVKVHHATNGSKYGKRCAKCQREHKRQLAYAYTQRPDIKAKRNHLNRRAYYYGPIDLEGESQWLSRSRVLLRNVKRMCQSANPDLWRFRSEAFTAAPTSRR